MKKRLLFIVLGILLLINTGFVLAGTCRDSRGNYYYCYKEYYNLDDSNYNCGYLYDYYHNPHCRGYSGGGYYPDQSYSNRGYYDSNRGYYSGYDSYDYNYDYSCRYGCDSEVYQYRDKYGNYVRETNYNRDYYSYNRNREDVTYLYNYDNWPCVQKEARYNLNTKGWFSWMY